MKEIYLRSEEKDFTCDAYYRGLSRGMRFLSKNIIRTETAEGKKIILYEVDPESVAMGNGETNHIVCSSKLPEIVIGSFKPVYIKKGPDRVEEVYIITLGT